MNKKVLIGIGVLAVLGIGYYVYTSFGKSDGGEGEGTGSGTNDPLKSSTGGTKPLVTRKEKRQACGFKPLFNKEKKALYQQCVDAGGVASFDGDDGL